LKDLDSDLYRNVSKGYFPAFYETSKLDGLVKSRHPVEKRDPGLLQVAEKPGFRRLPQTRSGVRRNDGEEAFFDFLRDRQLHGLPSFQEYKSGQA
jgi:hypothetical protein